MWVVFKKELYRVFSDKKLLFTTFFLSPLIMLGLFGVMIMVASFTANKIESNIPNVLINNAPEFLASPDGFEVTFREGESPENLADEVKQGNYDLAFDFDSDFELAIREGRIPEYRYFADLSNDYIDSAYDKMTKNYIEPFRKKTLAALLGGEEKLELFQKRDLSEEYEITKEKFTQGRIIGKFAPYMIFIVILGSAMGLVMESVAGEKERGTLATQLLSPISRERFALGKLLGLSVHVASATMVSVLTFFLLLFVLNTFIPGGMFSSGSLYGYKELILMSVILIPSLLMNTSVLMTLSSLGKNLKEATNYVMPFYMATIFLSMIPMQLPAGEPFAWWMYLIPVLGQVCALTDVLAFTSTPLLLFLSVLTPVIVTGGMIVIVRSIFNNEKYIVG